MTDTDWADRFLLTASSPREMRLARTALRMMIEELDACNLTGHTLEKDENGTRVIAYDGEGNVVINLGFERDGARPGT